MARLLSLLILISVEAHAQRKSLPKPQLSHCFEIKKLNTTPFLERQLGYVFVRDSNIICYQDTLFDDLDTVRIAYKTPNGEWLTFPTPFARQFLQSDIKRIDLDNDKRPELIIEGEASFESWPRGSASNYMTVIFRLDTTAEIIFQCTNGCSVSNLGGHYNDNPLDFGVSRPIKADSSGLHIGRLDVSALTEKNNQAAYKLFCRLSAITPGTYRLYRGKFMRQSRSK